MYHQNPFQLPYMKHNPYGVPQNEQAAVVAPQPKLPMVQSQPEKKSWYRQIAPILSPVAMGVAYSRTKSIPKAIGAGFVAPIYLAYVLYSTMTKKKR